MVKESFQPGTEVRFKIEGGALARIKRYLKDGFYEIRTVPDERELVAHEDDLALGWVTKSKDPPKPGYICGRCGDLVPHGHACECGGS